MAMKVYCIFCFAEETSDEFRPHCSRWCKDSQAIDDSGMKRLRSVSAPSNEELAERRAKKAMVN